MVHNHLQSVVSLLRPAKPSEPLPPDFEPGPKDVCSGRGKRNWNHAGNIAFRNLIQSNVEEYMTAPNKNEKTAIVCTIVDHMRREGCRFLQQNKQGLWFDIGDAKARDKVGHSLRDQVTAINRGQAQLPSKQQPPEPASFQQQQQHMQMPAHQSSTQSNTMEQMQQLYEQEHQMMALSDNEAEGEESHRRRSVMALPEITKFARRPSWIAGESLSSQDGMEGISPAEMEHRRSSAWGMLMDGNVLQDLMDLDVHVDAQEDHHQKPPPAAVMNPQQQQPFDTSYQTTTTTNMAVASAPSNLNSGADYGYNQYGNNDYNNLNMKAPVPLPERAPLVSTESQIALLMEEGDEFDADAEPTSPTPQQRLPNRHVVISDSSGLMRDSMKSWDPRNSANTSNLGEARMSDVLSSGSRRPTVRFSGPSLRRATNNFRLSDLSTLSMASDLFDELVDWGSQPANADDVSNFMEI